jgi:tyrosine-protein kinase
MPMETYSDPARDRRPVPANGAMNATGAEAFKALVRRSLPLVVVLTLLGAVALNAVRQAQGPRYQASARVLISSSPLASSITGGDSALADPRRVQATAEALASSSSVYKQAQRQGLGDAGALKDATTVGASGEDDLLSFTAVSTRPARAIGIANGVARAYSSYRGELSAEIAADAATKASAALASLPADSSERQALQDQLDQLRLQQRLKTSDAIVVDPANTAQKTSPNPVKDTILGLSIGLIVSLIIVALRAAVDTKIRSERDVEAALSLPILASIRTLPRGARLVTYGRHSNIYGDVYGLLAARITADIGEGGVALAVTSALAGEGKTTTSANLAVTLARRGARVILADLDSRKASATSTFGFPHGSAGVLEVLDGTVNLVDAMFQIELVGTRPEAIPYNEAHAVARTRSRVMVGDRRGGGGGGDGGGLPGEGSLLVLPAGRAPEDGHLPQQAYDLLIGDLREMADVVILDTPAALLTAEMTEVAPATDGVILVVRQGHTTQKSLQALERQSRGWPTALTGVVVTDVPDEDVYAPYGRA